MWQHHTKMLQYTWKLLTKDISLLVTFVNQSFQKKTPCTNTKEDILKHLPVLYTTRLSLGSLNLMRHKLVHNKKLKIRCPQCTQSFMTVSSMNQHAKTRMNQNKFKCDCFNFKTSTEDNLKQHVTGQHGWGIKAPCGFCLKW